MLQAPLHKLARTSPSDQFKERPSMPHRCCLPGATRLTSAARPAIAPQAVAAHVLRKMRSAGRGSSYPSCTCSMHRAAGGVRVHTGASSLCGHSAGSPTQHGQRDQRARHAALALRGNAAGPQQAQRCSNTAQRAPQLVFVHQPRNEKACCHGQQAPPPALLRRRWRRCFSSGREASGAAALWR